MNTLFTGFSMVVLFIFATTFSSLGQGDSVAASNPKAGMAAIVESLKQIASTAPASARVGASARKAVRQKNALSGGWLESYYPMHDGDWKTYTGAIGGRSIAQSDDFHFDSTAGNFIQAEIFNGSEADMQLGVENGQLLLYGMFEPGESIVFDPPLVFLSESILPKGGKVTSETLANVNGIEVNITCTMSVLLRGTITVPAGRYFDCRSLGISMSAIVKGKPKEIVAEGMVLAPGVGVIQSGVVGSSLNFLGWADLSDGAVNGVSVGSIIIESTAPKITIVSPAKNAKLTDPVGVLRGTASDNVEVGAVFCQINDGPWLQASGTSSWESPFELRPGTNVLRAYSTDRCNNCSPTNIVAVTYAVSAPLVVSTNGSGAVAAPLGGQRLEIGKNYMITATAKPGSLFVNWTGCDDLPLTNNRVLKFTMTSNLVLRANFLPDPYPATKGNYAGLFYPPASISASNSGFFQAALDGKGGFSSVFCLDGQTLRPSGGFDLSLGANLVVARPGKSSLRVRLQLVDSNLVGSVSTSDWTSELQALRATPAGSAAGTYTLLAAGDGVSQDCPPGDGCATVTIAANGTISAKGSLADGAPFNQTTVICQGGKWPFYCGSLYNNGGILIGWLQVDPSQAFSINTNTWLKPKCIGSSKYYTNGFNQACQVFLSHYTPLANGNSAVNWTNESVTISMGNLAEPLISQVIVSNNHVRVAGGSISNLNLTLGGKDGQFSGSFFHPGLRRKLQFKGALIQTDFGGGWFLGTNQAGAVHFEPVH